MRRLQVASKSYIYIRAAKQQTYSRPEQHRQQKDPSVTFAYVDSRWPHSKHSLFADNAWRVLKFEKLLKTFWATNGVPDRVGILLLFPLPLSLGTDVCGHLKLMLRKPAEFQAKICASKLFANHAFPNSWQWTFGNPLTQYLVMEKFRHP